MRPSLLLLLLLAACGGPSAPVEATPDSLFADFHRDAQAAERRFAAGVAMRAAVDSSAQGVVYFRSSRGQLVAADLGGPAPAPGSELALECGSVQRIGVSDPLIRLDRCRRR